MKPYHKSYWKTIILAVGFGCMLASCAVVWLLFGSDLVIMLDVPLILHFSALVLIVLLAPTAFFFAVAIGGFLSLYRDVSRAGRP